MLAEGLEWLSGLRHYSFNYLVNYKVMYLNKSYLDWLFCAIQNKGPS